MRPQSIRMRELEMGANIITERVIIPIRTENRCKTIQIACARMRALCARSEPPEVDPVGIAFVCHSVSVHANIQIQRKRLFIVQ